MDPAWLESIPFYEYQIWLDKLNASIEKENKKALVDSGKTEIFNFKS